LIEARKDMIPSPRIPAFQEWKRFENQEELTAHLTSFDEKKYENITQQIIHKSD
jgi:hypothetical protein